MGLRVDIDDLLDASQVASLLQLSNRTAVSVYRTRYSDFPEPVLDRGSGKCRFWLRQEIEAWQANREPDPG